MIDLTVSIKEERTSRTKARNISFLFYLLPLLTPTVFFFFSSRRRHTRSLCDWSSDVCSSDLAQSCEPPHWQLVGMTGRRYTAAGVRSIVSMNPTGRLTLPAEARRALGLSGEAFFEVHLEGSAVVLKPVAIVPLENVRAQVAAQHRAD